MPTLGTMAIGSTVKLKVNGKPTEFLVVNQGRPSTMYDVSCDGTWILMKDIYENRQWHSFSYNDYENSTIDDYLNGTWFNLLDANIRNVVKNAKIPYRPDAGSGKTVNSGASGLACKVFLLSGYEVGWTSSTSSYFPADGAVLEYFRDTASTDAKRIANLNGSATSWGLRSPDCDPVPDYSRQLAFEVSVSGSWGTTRCSYLIGVRPALILPFNLLVSGDGSVSTNTAPTTPPSITVPDSIMGGSDITVSWTASSDAESNLAGYKVERSDNGGGSWSPIYQGGALQTTDNVAFGTPSVMYRVKAYDREGLESGYKTSQLVTVTNNRAPSAPGSLTVPAIVKGGGTLAISWTAASDSDGNLSGYELERQVDSGSWSQIYKGSALVYTDTITAGWNTVAYRVRSYDTYSTTSTYVTSETRTVDNNALPVITGSTASGTDLGIKTDGFDLTYTVNDADKDTVTVKEYLDEVLKRTYTATLGQSNTVQCVTAANWQRVLNGAHTIKVVANDGKADSTPYTVSFTKKVTSASITLVEPLPADAAITVMVMTLLGSIPDDANLKVLVTNNAKDPSPVWEDATADIKRGANHIFTNKTATKGFAFNFKLTVSRGDSDKGGHISNIGGAFQ